MSSHFVCCLRVVYMFSAYKRRFCFIWLSDLVLITVRCVYCPSVCLYICMCYIVSRNAFVGNISIIKTCAVWVPWHLRNKNSQRLTVTRHRPGRYVCSTDLFCINKLHSVRRERPLVVLLVNTSPPSTESHCSLHRSQGSSYRFYPES
jgi:hypothetical protein